MNGVTKWSLLKIILSFAVSGEANFTMDHPGLTIGGFIQPSVAKSLVEVQANVEKGLCQRFLWIVPKPAAVPFSKLQQVDKDFSATIGMNYSTILNT